MKVKYSTFFALPHIHTIRVYDSHSFDMSEFTDTNGIQDLVSGG